MEAFERITSIAAPLMRVDVDTDQIIPTPYLVRTSEEGLGEGLFANWRRQPDGTPDPGFILNREPWSGARILLAGRNFGCGSSREAAPRALRQAGFRAVIAPSFGEIFFGNCFRNGLLPVRLAEAQVQALARLALERPATLLTVDLHAGAVHTADGSGFEFQTPPGLRRMLLEGLDEVDLTLELRDRIEEFRRRDRVLRPWAYAPRPGP